MILTTKIYFWFRSYILIIRRKNQSDELLKYLQSGSTLYFEAIKNPLVKQSSSTELIYDYNHDFQSQASFQTFCIFEIRPQYSEKCFFMIQSTVSIFSKLKFFRHKNCGDIWLKIAWQILLKEEGNLLQIFFEAHFWIGLKCDPSCKLYKKHITLEILAVVDPLPCWKTLMDHCVSLNTPSR